MPQKPWPVLRTLVPPPLSRKVSMSAHQMNDSTMASWLGASRSRKCSRVSAEKTTPQPKVSSGRLRSWTSISASGWARLARMAV